MSDPATQGADVAPAVPAFLAGIARQIATAIGGALATKGILAADGSQTEIVVGVVTILVSVAWGIYTRSKTRKAIVQAIAAPEGQAQ